jgi:hypothetical protein
MDGSIERDKGRKKGNEAIKVAEGNSDRLQNSKRISMGKNRRIQNRRESRVGPSRNSFDEAKGRERNRRKGVGDRNNTDYFFFFGIALLYLFYIYFKVHIPTAKIKEQKFNDKKFICKCKFNN